MTVVLGRDGGIDSGPAARLGHYRAADGSAGAPLALDLDGPHAALVVGKRGYGKSYTLGALAEALARTEGVAPVVVDPMGVFGTLAEPADADRQPVRADVLDPVVSPAALDARSWCDLLGLSPESGAGSLVWQAAASADTLAGMRAHVHDADAPAADRRAADNHLALADSWGVFDADGISTGCLGGESATVLDVSSLSRAPASAVVRAVGEALYRGRVDGTIDALPWLLVDEAHAFFDGVAARALKRLLTRGRAPGVSLVVATQRPSAVPAVAVSQTDLLVAHRLTAQEDLDALAAARPTYVQSPLAERLPGEPGEAVLVDDTTETVHAARIRERHTPHGGESPSVGG